MLKEMDGSVTLLISKVIETSFEDESAKFDEANTKNVYMVQELMDGSLHMYKVEDHFITWDESDEIA